MWCMTKFGFFSAVEHRDDPNKVLIRARSRRDLLDLFNFAEYRGVGTEFSEITATLDHADYPYRIEATKIAWATVLGAMVGDIDYDNFKTRIGRTNKARAATYGKVWEDLLRIEREPSAGVYQKSIVRNAEPRKIRGRKAGHR